MYKRISLKQQASIAKGLAHLLDAGISIHESLDIIIFQSRKHLQPILEKVKGDIQKGISISESFKQAHIFEDTVIHILNIGEITGNLSINFKQCAHYISQKDSFRKKIVSLMAYPACICLGILALSYFLLAYIFPKITPMFASMKATLPLSTRLLILLSAFLKQWGVVLIICIAFIWITLVISLKKYPSCKRFKDTLFLRIPLLKDIIKSGFIISLSKSLGLMLTAGLSIDQALAITAKNTPHVIYKEKIYECTQAIQAGATLSSYFKKYPTLFPLLFVHSIHIAEKSGMLGDMFLSLAHTYEEETETALKSLSGFIEPALMLAMGLVIGFISFSIISPIYSLTQNIQR